MSFRGSFDARCEIIAPGIIKKKQKPAAGVGNACICSYLATQIFSFF